MKIHTEDDKKGVVSSDNTRIEESQEDKIVTVSYDDISKDVSRPQKSDIINHEKKLLSLDTFPGAERVPYPEGGLEAWLVVLGSFTGTVASFGFMNSSMLQSLVIMRCSDQTD
jgi:hypothetical protein